MKFSIQQRITSLKSIISTSSDNKKKKKNEAEADDTNTYTLDNKYLYEKATMRELEAADDYHPLKVENNKFEAENQNVNTSSSEGVFKLNQQLETVALDWKSLRNIKECSCSTPFDHFSRKVFHY